MEYFKKYKEAIEKYGILPEDQWNFDETGYCMEMSREDWVITVDSVKKFYSKCLDNWESLTSMECINGVGCDIPPLLILCGLQQLHPWFNNDLNNIIAVTTTDTGFTNDGIFLQ